MSTETHAKRFNAGKPPLSRILEFKGAIEGIARIMAFGDKKYGRLNWQLGMSHTEVADSLLRHLTSWMSGEDLDPESGELHLDHVAINAMFLSYFTRYRREFDDRTPTPTIDPRSMGSGSAPDGPSSRPEGRPAHRPLLPLGRDGGPSLHGTRVERYEWPVLDQVVKEDP